MEPWLSRIVTMGYSELDQRTGRRQDSIETVPIYLLLGRRKENMATQRASEVQQGFAYDLNEGIRSWWLGVDDSSRITEETEAPGTYSYTVHTLEGRSDTGAYDTFEEAAAALQAWTQAQQ